MQITGNSSSEEEIPETALTRHNTNSNIKEVIFITPVIFGSQYIPHNLSSRKIRYQRGLRLHQDEVPESCQRLPRGMVISLPLTEIEAFVAEKLSWLPLKTDDELVDGLHNILRHGRPQGNMNDITVKSLDLTSTHLFKGLD